MVACWAVEARPWQQVGDGRVGECRMRLLGVWPTLGWLERPPAGAGDCWSTVVANDVVLPSGLKRWPPPSPREADCRPEGCDSLLSGGLEAQVLLKAQPCGRLHLHLTRTGDEDADEIQPERAAPAGVSKTGSSCPCDLERINGRTLRFPRGRGRNRLPARTVWGGLGSRRCQLSTAQAQATRNPLSASGVPTPVPVVDARTGVPLC